MNPAVGRIGKAVLTSYFVVMLVFLYVPLLVIVVFAFNDALIPTLPLSGFTTQWFHNAFANTDLTGALQRSAVIALINGVAATILDCARRSRSPASGCSCDPYGRRFCCCRWWCRTSSLRSAW